MNNLVKLILSSLLLFALLFSLDHKWESIPRIAPFFSPFEGFWVQASGKEPPVGTLEFGLPGLKKGVSVSYDSLGVPHIFTETNEDLYFMQGFVTARDRLWQMEVQSYSGAGRLTELLGESMLDYDRYQRRIGMVYGAEKLIEKLKQDSVSWQMVQSYTEGVNAWINQLDASEYPIEYKLLDIEPEPWTELKSGLLLMSMTYTLAGYSRDLQMTNALLHFGSEWVEKYLTARTPMMDPIIPTQDEWKDWKVDRPNRPEGADQVPEFIQELIHKDPEEGNGSNNWAISGDKTASGYPMLANDPHLNMTAPSIWYQMQLHGPDVNVVGATLPGAPCVIIGFNEHVAWGVTNVDADVLDYYALKTRSTSPNQLEYEFEGSWLEASSRIENYKIRNGETITERIFYSHHGPIVPNSNAISLRRSEVKHTALKWIGHNSDNSFKTFYDLNRAKNYEDFVRSLVHYSGPAQNFVFASNEGDIALWVNGQFPNKWEGQGRYIMDGSKKENDWSSSIPHQHNPHMRNPERGFVSSANQRSTSADYPYWIQDRQAPFSRGKRINEQLATMQHATVEDFRHLQMDAFNYQASELLAEMLKRVDGDKHSNHLELLRHWDFYHQSSSTAATIFSRWSDNLYRSLTNDEVQKYGIYRPSKDMLLALMQRDEVAPWFDDIETDEVETLEQLVNKSWDETIMSLTKDYGDEASNWKWAKENEVHIRHIAQIPGLGFKGIVTSGSALSINAVRAPSHGPSWRMIVEAGPKMKGFATYPGGQSGNPGSPWYDNMLNDWIEGQLQPIRFYETKDDALKDARFSILMRANRKDELSK